MIEPISQNPVFFSKTTRFGMTKRFRCSVPAGRRIAEALAQNSAIILRNHGLLTAGDSVAAVGRFVYMERVAELHMKVHEPKPTAEAARFAKADLIRMGLGAISSLLRRHIPDPDVVN